MNNNPIHTVPLCAALRYMSNLFCLTVMLMPVANALSADDQPPVIAVAPFNHGFESGWSIDQYVVGVRDRVIAGLIENYDCVVVNRSYGYSMAIENSINRFSSLVGESDNSTLSSADVSFSGVFRMLSGGVYECNIRYADLQKPLDDKMNVTVVSSTNITSIVPLIIDNIAKTAGLSGRQINKRTGTDEEKKIWMVLPTSLALDKADLSGKSEAFRNSMDARAEMILQDIISVKLVDRSFIDKILSEHSLPLLADSGNIGSICRLTGAKRVLSCSLCMDSMNVYHLTVMVVDSETTEVLSAATKSYSSKDEAISGLKESIVNVVSLTKPPATIVADKSRRCREAELYVEFTNALNYQRTTSSFIAMIDFGQMAYLLGGDDVEIVKKIAMALYRCVRLAQTRSVTPALKKQCMELAEKIAKAHEDAGSDPDVLLERLRACMAVNNYDLSAQIFDKLEGEYSDKLDKDSRVAMAESFLAGKKPDEALRCVAEFSRVPSVIRVRVKAYQQKGDEDAEFEVLSGLNTGYLHGHLPRYANLLAKRKGHEYAGDYIQSVFERQSKYSV